jgi:UDP-N-acetylmuramoyl-L-alanyl-D-glutamate--2,6-diaminopimelate ligase
MDSLETRLLSELESVSGRFQYIVSTTTAIVDYAHTLTHWKTLKTTNDIRLKRTVDYGCNGGNRDKTKRPIMASIASELSDKVFLL